MAKIKVKNPDTFVAPDNAVNEMEFSGGMTKAMQNSGEQIASITITVGTWKFGVGEAPAASSPSYGVGDTVQLPLNNGTMNIFAQASAQNDAFKVSAI